MFSEFRVISQIWEAITTTKGIKIDPYCQRQNFSLYRGQAYHSFQRCVDYADIAGRSSARGSTIRISLQWAKMTISILYTRNISQSVSSKATVTINHQQEMT